jgi:hypothetical protein
VLATLEVVIGEQASAERAASPWNIGHDPELVPQSGGAGALVAVVVHPASGAAKSNTATAEAAMLRRRRIPVIRTSRTPAPEPPVATAPLSSGCVEAAWRKP